MGNKTSILVTGGAGYIGSVVSKILIEENFQVIIVDNLTKGHKQAIQNEAKFYHCSTLNKEALNEVFEENPQISAIMHFAASIEVGESVVLPDKYFYNNVLGSLNVIDLANKHKKEGFILSSTAAVYGDPKTIPINESSPTIPINPYGFSKLQVEQFLKYYYNAYKLKYSCLRYFNACGSYKNLGEDHNPETHLIPNIYKTILGGQSTLKIFGDKYNTHDGTAIRDYIHVEDLARAHILALKAILESSITNEAFNIGSGSGYSVEEVVKAAEEASGRPISRIIADPRPGDAPRLIADTEKIQSVLGWKPEHELKSMLKSAWEWHKSNPEGYKD
ncbi:MAG: UDP-glucose 4-epimerase GalE [Cyanobacteriota bacterium]